MHRRVRIPEGAPSLVSVMNAEGPPVPIPNTEVKLCSAENTCLATSRENRSALTQISLSKSSSESVFLTQRVHLFPFRTQKLSSAVPKILAWRRAGKIGQSRHHYRKTKVAPCFPVSYMNDKRYGERAFRGNRLTFTHNPP